jgi:hypothetical protein
MSRKWQAALLPAVLVFAAAAEQGWKDKQIAQWTEEDAREVLTRSPWAQQTTPEISRQSGYGNRGGMGRGSGGIGMGGIGMGIPGMGGGRRGGMGGGGGPYGGGGGGQRRGGDEGERRGPPTLTVRWESAFPVREAVLKAKDTTASSIEEKYYAVAVLGIPARMTDRAGKPKAELKREGKKTIKSADVRTLSRDDGTMMVFLFPKDAKKEITANDQKVAFEAQIGRMSLHEVFVPAEMMYDGKLQL